MTYKSNYTGKVKTAIVVKIMRIDVCLCIVIKPKELTMDETQWIHFNDANMAGVKLNKWGVIIVTIFMTLGCLAPCATVAMYVLSK